MAGRVLRRPEFIVLRQATSSYRAAYTVSVLSYGVLGRALMQTFFFSLVGRLLNGEPGEIYAFVGALGMVCATAGIIQCPDVIIEDRWQRTLYQLRLGNLPLLYIMLLRSYVYVAQGFLASLCALAVAGPLIVGSRITIEILGNWPALLLSAVSAMCLGMLVAVISLGRRAEVLVANGAYYAVLVLAGAVTPISGHPVLAAVGDVTPLHHAISYLRLALAGHSQPRQLLDELFVAVGWLAPAPVILSVQSRRARRHGFDDFD